MEGCLGSGKWECWRDLKDEGEEKRVIMITMRNRELGVLMIR